MKLLIAYTSKNGVSKRCAEMLAKNLPDTVEATLTDLAVKMPRTADHDAVVLGGSIRMGSLDKKIKALLRELKKESPALPCALFICCGLSQRFEEYADTQLPLGYHPLLGVHHFGGELKPENAKGFDRILIRHMRKSIKELDFEDGDTNDISLPEIIPENILLLAEKIRKLEKDMQN